MAIARISITLPKDLARAIDARAKELDRSRSWVVAEAARRFLEEGRAEPLARGAEPVTPYAVSPGLGASRLAQLEADLKLTPEERVRIAEELAREARLASPRPLRTNQILAFDTLEEYFEWKRREGSRP